MPQPKIKQKIIGDGDYVESSTGVMFVIKGENPEVAHRVTLELAEKVEALVATMPEVELVLPSNFKYWQLTASMYEVVRTVE